MLFKTYYTVTALVLGIILFLTSTVVIARLAYGSRNTFALCLMTFTFLYSVYDIVGIFVI